MPYIVRQSHSSRSGTWTLSVRCWMFDVRFCLGKPRPAQADESLAALLARRDKVRAERPAEPSPDLFRPTTPVAPPVLPGERPVFTPQQEEAPVAEEKPADQAASTTSRLLEAKRRAQKRKE